MITASGSRGEVQPFIAIAIELRRRGCIVSIASEERMRSLIEEFGFEYKRLAGDPTGALFEPDVQPVLQRGNMMELIKFTEAWDKKFDKAEILQSYVTACSGADIVVGAQLTISQSYCVAEMLRIPFIPVLLGPTLPTSEFPIWALKSLVCYFCCGCFVKWTYNAAFRMLWTSEQKFINPWRVSLGLAPIVHDRGIVDIMEIERPPILIACSPLMCGPHQRVPRDYPSNAHVSGFVFVRTSSPAEVDSELVRFVESAGRPLVYLGFGSMPAVDPVGLVRIALEAATASNVRAVLCAGWSQLEGAECAALVARGRESGSLFVTKAAPHDWLFPKMSCIVHHCGIGTTASALSAGVPQIPCPVMLDQPHNAQLVVKLGVAPAVLPFQELSAKRLSDLISRVVDVDSPKGSAYARTAATLGQQVRHESEAAITSFCDIIESAARNKQHVPNCAAPPAWTRL